MKKTIMIMALAVTSSAFGQGALFQEDEHQASFQKWDNMSSCQKYLANPKMTPFGIIPPAFSIDDSGKPVKTGDPLVEVDQSDKKHVYTRKLVIPTKRDKRGVAIKVEEVEFKTIVHLDDQGRILSVEDELFPQDKASLRSYKIFTKSMKRQGYSFNPYMSGGFGVAAGFGGYPGFGGPLSKAEAKKNKQVSKYLSKQQKLAKKQSSLQTKINKTWGFDSSPSYPLKVNSNFSWDSKNCELQDVSRTMIQNPGDKKSSKEGTFSSYDKKLCDSFKKIWDENQAKILSCAELDQNVSEAQFQMYGSGINNGAGFQPGLGMMSSYGMGSGMMGGYGMGGGYSGFAVQAGPSVNMLQRQIFQCNSYSFEVSSPYGAIIPGADVKSTGSH